MNCCPYCGATAKANPLAERVEAFFNANPDEELTKDDIGTKFDHVTKNVGYALASSVAAGRIALRRQSNGRGIHNVYSRGAVGA